MPASVEQAIEFFVDLARTSPWSTGAGGAALLLLAWYWFWSSLPVLRVVDGDTIVVKISGRQEKVRLLGIDAPESVHPDKRATAGGKAASAHLRRLLHRRRIRLHFDGSMKRDKYGRILAYVRRFPDGLDVNLHLVSEGYARVYRAQPFRRKDEFLAAEQDAQRDGRGIWRGRRARRRVAWAIVASVVASATWWVYAHPAEAEAAARRLAQIRW